MKQTTRAVGQGREWADEMPAPSRWQRFPYSFMVEFTVILALFGSRELLRATDSEHPSSPRANASPEWKTEIKLFLTAENAAQAVKALKLDEHRAVKETVCFFDTRDRALERNNLILRARQKAGQPGESTVKLRAAAAGTKLSDTERAIPAEEDWTNESAPTLSRSVDHRTLADGLVSKVSEGQAPVEELFNEAQQQLVAARIKGFDWKSLRRYGPVEAEVWNQQWNLAGFSEALTVELWHLRKTGRTQDILEVSTKARVETEEQAKGLARQFFDAAKTAGLGRPTGQTKTRKVLNFFSPGR